ncbi:WD40 repeat [Arabidopsis suecica]|uniref:SEC12-like protein n=1 Tax=Arabidopsis suecica TaxID=45249 RepID=A0A8T1ZXB6_ARASU|nr:WD40 repeat [Arabidopsis suecica]
MEIEEASRESGHVVCGSWIRRPKKVNWVLIAKASKRRGSSVSSPALLNIFSFDPVTASLSSSPLATHTLKESDGDPVTVSVHPGGDYFVCSTSKGGCKSFEIVGGATCITILAKELLPLQNAGLQKCMAFSFDGSKLAAGGVDGCLRIMEWPNLSLILDEPKAHKSIRDMDFSLDSEFLATTSTDGSARIWKAEDGFPLSTLERSGDESIELCRFSKDGTKPFLFCAAQRGDTPLVNVYDISTWKKLGFKKLSRKTASTMAVSLDGKYIALGGKDGDVSVAEVKTMEIYHYSKRLHLGQSIASLEFCPSERVMLTTSSEWGEMVTKLSVPKEWKEWQIYALLFCLFMASVIAAYVFFENSDSFWRLPMGKDQKRPKISLFGGSSSTPSEDHSRWNLDL